MSPSVIENFVVGVVTSVVTAIGVWLWSKIQASQVLNQRAAFFGIAPKENCLVVMNHSARDQSVMTHGDVETLVEVVRLVDKIGGKLSIARFDRILEPAGEMSEFCIGGPDSNQRTKVHLENFLKGIRHNPYSPDSPDNIAIVTKEEIYRYKRHEDEYAVLSRFYPDPDSYPVILICGQTSRSNQGAIHYLVKSYDGFLRKKFGSKKPFCLVLKLQSPLTYGFKSVQLVKDVTDTAFVPLVN